MPDQPQIATVSLDRRRVLLTGGVVVAAAAVTAACGSSSSDTATAAARYGGSGSSAAPTSASPASAGVTVAEADVPVGGGVVLADAKVVVTQPTKGTFKAFTAVCTHQGCIVASVSNGTIMCPCHGSTYSAADGSVQGGPAPAPLAPVPVTASGTTLTVGT